MKSTYKAWVKVRKSLGWKKWDPMIHPTSCPLCLKPFQPWKKNRHAVWDHCHACADFVNPPGSFRGYICDLCNSAEPHRGRKVAARGIQHLIRDPEWQKRLSDYLDAHRCFAAMP